MAVTARARATEPCILHSRLSGSGWYHVARQGEVRLFWEWAGELYAYRLVGPLDRALASHVVLRTLLLLLVCLCVSVCMCVIGDVENYERIPIYLA